MADLEYKYVTKISTGIQILNSENELQNPTVSSKSQPSETSLELPLTCDCPESVKQQNSGSADALEMGLEEKHKSDKGGADKEKKPKRTPRPPPPPGLKDDLTTIAHICVVLFVGLILYLCFSHPFEFFTWHPLLLSVGWMLLMTEGVLFISKENPIGRRLNLGRLLKVRFHWISLVISLILVTAGFIVVVITKNERGKEHFKTYHAIFGLIALLGCIPAVVNGTVSLFDVELKRYIKPALNTAIHVASGSIVVFFGGLSLIMSVFTNWFKRNTDNNKYLLMLGLASAIYVLVWTLQRPLRKTLRKFFKFENI